MPHGDGTGPLGMGARTGRAAGYCAGFGVPGYASAALGRGLGAGLGRGMRASGFGGGRGWRNRFYATGLPGWIRAGYGAGFPGVAGGGPDADPGLQKQMLKSQADAMQAEVDLLRKRLAEIETGEGAE